MATSTAISGRLRDLARRLLYLWVRTEVLPASGDIGEGGPVCYVIQDRRLSNVLVLDEETRRLGLPRAGRPMMLGGTTFDRAFFCLTRPQPLIAEKAQDRYAHSRLLGRLVDALRADAALDVRLVPVTILWGRAPREQDSILKALFSETWRPPGHFRQWMAILLHGRQVLVRFGAPMALGELVRGEPDAPRALRKVQRILRVHFRRQREMAIGPDLSHRNTQIGHILAAPAVQRAIADEAAARGTSFAEAAAKARGYAREIMSDYSHAVVRAMELFLTWLWNRIYDGIEVHHFDAVAGIAAGQGIVYVPCHRSHIDYLLLSYVVYKRGLSPPHIAAGANLDLPVVGPILRRGGAFFLRRSFKGEPLYAAVFDEYLHLLISRGFPIEYFIEGGRSRSGRMLPPRTGILGMTLKSFVRGHERPLLFVPVYIGYEKLIEGASFLDELAGKPKRKESLWDLVATIRRLRHEFGKVHVNFGEPLPLADFLDARHPGWRDGPADGAAPWLRDSTIVLARELARRINAAAVVNPVNLVALALLAAPKHALDEETARRMIAHHQALLAGASGPRLPVACTEAPEAVIAHALRLGLIERVSHPLGDLIRVAAGEGALLAYFRNNVLHLFALPALVACLASHHPRLDAQRGEAAIGRLMELVRAELFLHGSDDDTREALERVLAVLCDRGLIVREADEWRAPDPGSLAFAELQLIGETMRPTLERNLLALELLVRHGSGRLSRKRLEELCQRLAERLALLYEYNAPEFAERGVFASVVDSLIATGMIDVDAEGLVHFDARIAAPASDAELLLSAETRQTIRRLAGASPSPTNP